MKGAWASFASRRAISVLPTPVGPIIRMFLGRHLLAQLGAELLAAPAVAQRHRDGALGVGLADDVAVELGDDLARGEGLGISSFLVTFRAALIEAQHHQVVVVDSRPST